MGNTAKQSFAWLGVFATLLALVAIAWLFVQDVLANRRGRTIEQVHDARWNHVILAFALLIIAALWVAWLGRKRGIRFVGTIATSGVLAVMLVLTPILAWRASTQTRDITITNMRCEAEALQTIGGDPLMDCEDAAVDSIVQIGEVTDDKWRVPDVMEGNQKSVFSNLPSGGWDARVMVDGPADVTAVHIVDMQTDRGQRIATLQPQFDEESGYMRWSGVVRVPGSTDTLRALFYVSPTPAAPSAKLRFSVMQCAGQVIRDFVASACEPAMLNLPLVMETPTDTARTWRYPHSVMNNGVQTVSNLEPRSYTFQPDYPSIQIQTRSTDVLVIPAPMEQVEANSISTPGEDTFVIDIATNTGPVDYIVYVFPTGPTYAFSD